MTAEKETVTGDFTHLKPLVNVILRVSETYENITVLWSPMSYTSKLDLLLS